VNGAAALQCRPDSAIEEEVITLGGDQTNVPSLAQERQSEAAPDLHNGFPKHRTADEVLGTVVASDILH
jgi:hypothetical protein